MVCTTPTANVSFDFRNATIDTATKKVSINGTIVGEIKQDTAGDLETTQSATDGLVGSVSEYFSFDPKWALRDTAQSSVTIEIYFKMLNGDGFYNGIFSAYNSATQFNESTMLNNFQIERNQSNDTIQFWTGDVVEGTSHNLRTTTSSVGMQGVDFEHLVCIYDGVNGKKSVYMNGVISEVEGGVNGDGTYNYFGPYTQMIIGRTPWTNDNGVEYIRFFRHYDRVLTAEEIEVLYNARDTITTLPTEIGVVEIYGTLRDSKPYFIIDSPNVEASGNLNVLQKLDVCGNITFNNTDLSCTLANLVVDLTGGQDASFTNVDISGSLILNNIDISGKLTQIDASLVNLASSSSGGTVTGLYDLIPNAANSSAIINQIANNFKQLTWLNYYSNEWVEGPPHYRSNQAFFGGVLAPNGKVILIPHGSDFIGIYDPITNIFSNGPNIGSDIRKFRGGVLAPNGKIIFVPHDSSKIGIYDPYNNTYDSNGPAHNKGSQAFSGGVLAPNGEIIFAPYKSDKVGIYDPINNIFKESNSHNELSESFNGAVLAPNGKIVFVPWKSSKIGIYDPSSNIYSSGPGHGLTGGNGSDLNDVFSGGVLGPDGKIYLIPWNTYWIGIYDITNNTFSMSSLNIGRYKYDGGLLAPDGRIVLPASLSTNIAALYNVYDNTITLGAEHSIPGYLNRFKGGILTPNGKIVLVPYDMPNIFIFGNEYLLKNENDALSPYFNKF